MWLSDGFVEVVGTLPAEDVLGPLGDDTLVAHRCYLAGDLIGVNKLGIAEYTRGDDTEEFTELRLLHTHLISELNWVIERGD